MTTSPAKTSGAGKRVMDADNIDQQPATSFPRCLALVLLVLVTAGCIAPTTTRESYPASAADATEYRSPGIRIRLIDALRAGDRGTLLESPGWVEYVLTIDNTGSKPLRIHDVKLLNADGRYLDSAASYGQIIAPPDVASAVAGEVATRTAGIAVGQVVPFGGAIVGIISKTVSASTAESRENAERAFERHKLKAVELAPGGKIAGSAFLPDLAAARTKALVVGYGHGKRIRQIEIRLLRRGT